MAMEKVIATATVSLLLVAGMCALFSSRTSPSSITPDRDMNTVTNLAAQESVPGIFTDTTAAKQCPFGYDAKESSPSPCPFLSTPITIAPSQEVTSKGCDCSSTCGPSAPDFKCDWCYTKNECGNMGISGHWDYCVYPAEAKFDAQDHDTKANQLWAKVMDETMVGKSAPVLGLLGTVKAILTESMITAFDDHMETFPKMRKKVIHVQGVNCPFRLTTTSKQFTGIFEQGQTTGMIRMGSATNLETKPGLFPGFGIKWLRSGVGSADFVALRETGPGGSWDYFATTLGNHVAPAEALKATGKFQQASGCIDMVGLSNVCKWDQKGNKVEKPVFPFEILFEAGDIHFSDEKKGNKDLVKELESIAVGSKLFNVYTYASPNDKISGKKTVLGEMTTIGECHASLFGDQHLFFRHQRMEEDFALAPEWIPQMSGLKDTACSASAAPIAGSNWQCVSVPGKTAGY